MTYIVNDTLELSYEGFREFLYAYIIENNIDIGEMHHILPTTSLKRNINHHPVRIARELGFKVTVIQ